MSKLYPLAVTPLIKTLFAIATTFVVVLASAQEQTPALKEFQAKYKAYKYGKSLGHADMALKKTGEDSYTLSYASKVSLFLISDKRYEESDFRYKNGTITPLHYAYTRKGTGSDKSLDATFNSTTSTIELKGMDDLAWQGELDNQLYRLDLQLKLASGADTFEYTLLNYRGEKRHYKLQVMGKEQLELPYGMLEGIKVKIMRENKKRETFAWFAPSLNYQLVRLQQFKEGDEQGDIKLSEFTLSE